MALSDHLMAPLIKTRSWRHASYTFQSLSV
ncbi:hypothetical protein CCACVL1_16064 [Corchorus capsularis]|uniref:Uncharacterized protein n=1 Tax=Corchorus capsularis TaxID=210143 RepID=A0A1R3HZQ2_COCAP|nr:hypothetical protein CCACVL1_16064 [Corchorus capsularis]